MKGPNRLTLLLLIDAFRADYVQYTPYIRRLTMAGAGGALRECFGFVQQSAYFGGLSPAEYGFSNMYCFDPQNSPFSIARSLPSGLRGEREINLRELIAKFARGRSTAFAAHYVSSLQIPIEYLPYFDVVEKWAPWDRRAGYRSLFTILDEMSIPWYQCSWPSTNALEDRTDRGIVSTALDNLKPPCRFGFVHLQELDGIGHLYGPGSKEIIAALSRTDKYVELLLETLKRRYDSVNLLLFGDHGMVNVVRTIDVWKVLKETGLRFGNDYAFFLDSTMARFWFYHARARRTVMGALSELPGGSILDSEALSRLKVAECDPRNGQLIFLADPGVLVFPNFFQVRGIPNRGMHGYDPCIADNMGHFLIYDPDSGENFGGYLGEVDATAIFPAAMHLLNLANHDEAAVFHAMQSRPRRSYTQNPEPDAEALVASHMEQLTGAVLDRVGSVEAIVLTGSFGRAEGGVTRTQEGRLQPVNDYDLFVVADADCSGILKEIGADFVGPCGLDYLDLGYSDGDWFNLPLTVFNFDLKYGSQVIYGNKNILDRLPEYASADIPVFEGVQLLLNRTAGILTGFQWGFDGKSETTGQQERYLANQISKALMSIGDWNLIRWHAYDASYRIRMHRFESLAKADGLPPGLICRVCAAYRFKLSADYSLFPDVIGAVRELYPDMQRAIVDSCEALTGLAGRDISSATKNFLEFMSGNPNCHSDNLYCSNLPELKPCLRKGDVSIRYVIYSALPLILGAVVDPSRRPELFFEAVRRLQLRFNVSTPGLLDVGSLEQLRSQVISWWFALIH